MQNEIRFLDIYIRLVAWKPIHILRAKLSNQKANKEAPIKQNEKHRPLINAKAKTHVQRQRTK